MLLKLCTGFHSDAVAHWVDFKHGYEYSAIEANSNIDNSCYICFNPLASAAQLAARSFRAIQLLGKSVEISFRLSKSYVVLLNLEMLSNSAVICDILGGIVFRSAQNFLIIPDMSDHLELVNGLFSVVSGISVSSNSLLRKLGLSPRASKSILQRVLCVTLARDLFRIYQLDERQFNDELVVAVDTLLHAINVTGLNWRDSNCVNAYLDGMRTEASQSMQNEWETGVIEMYDRPNLRKKKDSSATNALVVDNWLQCDACSKWRIVSSFTASEFEDKPFQCKNVENKTCSDISDDLLGLDS